MKRLLLVVLLMASGLMAQPLTTAVNITPDCLIFFDFTDNGSSASFDNRFLGCKTWYVAYTSTGFPALTLTFQDAPDNSGAPGAWVAFAGTVVEGVNPNIAVTEASTIMYGYYPWQRITLSGVTAAAGRRIRGTFYGYRQTPVASVIMSGLSTVTANQGTPNTNANRWPVFWSDGANPLGTVGNPPYFRLSNGVNARGDVTAPLYVELTDGSNEAGIVSNPAYFRLSDGTNPAGTLANPLATGTEYYNGTLGLWAPAPACNNRAAITIAGAGTTEIVALSGATQIRICHVSLLMAGATNLSLVQGTGLNCAGATANVTGAYTNALGIALDFEGRSLVTLTAGNALCITNSAAVAGGGIVVYAQY